MSDWIWVIAFLTAFAVVLLLTLREPQRSCGKCGKPLPRLRVPRSLQQLLQGGWTCPHCGADLDRRGGVRRVKE